MTEPTYTDYVELRKSDDPPPPAPQEDSTRFYADEDGALRSMQSDGTDAPVAGAGVLPNPTNEGDVLTVVDGEWAGAAGGGSQPITRAVYSMNGTVPSGTFANVPWENAQGDPLLDLTDPANPLIIDPGVYAISASIWMGPQSPPDTNPADVAAGVILCDWNSADPVLQGNSYLPFQWLMSETTADLAGQKPASITGYIPATSGPAIQIQASNSSVDVGYEINVMLQRLS